MRVLIVEDEMTIAFMLEDMLLELGHEVAEVAMRLDPAVEAARTLEFDIAILDVNLDGLTSFPVANLLRERNIPFAFSTGYGPGAIPDAFADIAVLPKPLTMRALENFMLGQTDLSGSPA